MKMYACTLHEDLGVLAWPDPFIRERSPQLFIRSPSRWGGSKAAGGWRPRRRFPAARGPRPFAARGRLSPRIARRVAGRRRGAGRRPWPWRRPRGGGQGGALVVVDRSRLFYPPAAVGLGNRSGATDRRAPDSEADHAWALDQTLRSRGVAAVWPVPTRTITHLRRWQLAGETSGVLGLLLRGEAARRTLLGRIAAARRAVAASRQAAGSRPPLARGIAPLAADVPAGNRAWERDGAASTLTATIETQQGRIQQGRGDEPGTCDMKRALCIWLPNWPLQRLAAAREELRSRAVVLYQLHAAAAARVVAYCPHLAGAAAATWSGDRAAPPASAPACPWPKPGLLAEYAHSVSPEAKKPSALHIGNGRSTGRSAGAGGTGRVVPAIQSHRWPGRSRRAGKSAAGRDWPGPTVRRRAVLASGVVREFRQRDLTARVAIADTLGAAWAVAAFCRAKLPGRAQNAAAILAALRVPLVVPPGQRGHGSRPCRSRPCDCRRKLARCWPIWDCGASNKWRRCRARRCWRVSGPRCWNNSIGPPARRPRPLSRGSCRRSGNLTGCSSIPPARREMIELALAQLIARACQALVRERRGMLRLECRFEHERARGRALHGRFVSRPAPARGMWSELVRLKLEATAISRAGGGDSRDGVGERSAGISASRKCFRRSGAAKPPRAAELAALVDRLSNRLGAHAVVRPWLLASAQPEFACHYQPLAGLAARPARKQIGRARPRTAPSPLEAPAIGRCIWSRRRGGWTWCRSCPRVRRCSFAWRAATSGSCARGGRSGSKPAGGAALRAPRLLPGGNRRRPALLAVSPVDQRAVVFARGSLPEAGTKS